MSKDISIVGVGASAGGLEAVHALIASLKPGFDRAFVLVQHLDPDHQSLLPELLARRADFPVVAIEDGMRVEAGKFYLIPTGAFLTAAKGLLHLASFDIPRGLRRPIDHFFQSLAADLGARCGAIILSGTGSDGSIGARAVKEAGGIVLVQDPNQAKYDGMPKSAIATNAVDLVLPAGDMPAVLNDYFDRRAIVDPAIDTDAEFIDRVAKHVLYRTGHDFSHYKKPTLRRRLARRMSIVGARSPHEYLQKLIGESGEASQLFHDILINVTSFFRDEQTFEPLRRLVLPQIFQDRTSSDEVRIWVPACSTGQEAYSIAMLVEEEMSRLSVRPKVSIFATDIDGDAIQIARNATYPNAIAGEIPSQFLERYFTSSPQGFTVNSAIRELLRFSRHSLIKDPPFSKLDLISCRNMLIYFEERLQEQTIEVFRYALKPGGFLMLGLSENVSNLGGGFKPVDAAGRLFQRREGPAPPLPLPFFSQALTNPSPPDSTPSSRPVGETSNIYEKAVLARHTPPYVVVNERDDVVYSSARTGRYIELPAGRSHLNIVDLAKEGLRAPVRGLLADCPSEPGSPVYRRFESAIDEQPAKLLLSIERLADDNKLIVFQDRFDPTRDGEQGGVVVDSARDADAKLIRDLQSRLEAAQKTIRSTIQELETSNEELKSSNEEMMSMNEVLQSTNEELKTSNEELNNKIAELNTLNDDQRNLAVSTRIPTLFLDSELRIRSFTPETALYFRLVERDVGRAFEDISSNLAGDSLVQTCRETLASQRPCETERSDKSGETNLLVRIQPYVTKSGAVDGVVVTLTDVTELRRYAQELEDSRTEANLRLAEIEELYRVTPQAKALLDRNFRFLRVNQRMADINGIPVESHIGKHAADIFPQLSDVIFQSARKVFETGEPVTSTEISAATARGELRVWDIDWYPVKRGSEIYAAGINVRDITSHKAMEMQLRRLMRELQHRVKNMLANVIALVNRARGEHGDPKIVMEKLVERIKALAATHNLLTAHDWRPTGLVELLRPELTAVYGDKRIVLRGPAIQVNARTTLGLSMAIHELATNAAKYGSLSVPDGMLSISWLRIDEGEGEKLRIKWEEKFGPEVVSPRRYGFGTQLVKTTVEGSFGGTYESEFEKGGLTCTISLPIDRTTEEEGDAAAELEAAEGFVR